MRVSRFNVLMLSHMHICMRFFHDVATTTTKWNDIVFVFMISEIKNNFILMLRLFFLYLTFDIFNINFLCICGAHFKYNIQYTLDSGIVHNKKLNVRGAAVDIIEGFIWSRYDTHALWWRISLIILPSRRNICSCMLALHILCSRNVMLTI